jgi:hypothetical protein
MEAWEERIEKLVNRKQSELDSLPDYCYRHVKRKKKLVVRDYSPEKKVKSDRVEFRGIPETYTFL